METFDINRVHWTGDKYKKWQVTQTPQPLANSGLDEDEILLVVEQHGERWAFILKEVIYPHIVQGDRGGQPYMITFCGLCNAGVRMNPVIDRKLHHFSVAGLYNGQMICTDDETKSVWNHLTGEALHGVYAGRKLEVWYLKMTTVGEEMKIDPQLDLYISGLYPFRQRMMKFILKHVIESWVPPYFKPTLGQVDPRLPKMTMGLAIEHRGQMKFFARNLFRNKDFPYQWDDRTLTIYDRDPIPHAVWEDGKRPFQLFTRWYAFCLTYPKGVLVEDIEPSLKYRTKL